MFKLEEFDFGSIEYTKPHKHGNMYLSKISYHLKEFSMYNIKNRN